MFKGTARPLACIAILAAFALQTLSPAFAGTVGTISGTVTQSETHAVLADVTVVATSASGTYRATTDTHGFFAMTGVAPDTYTVSFTHEGFEPASTTGVTVNADQVAHVDETLLHTTKTIARVTSRSPGGAFQPHETADTYSVTQSQIQTIQGSALNISEKSLLTALPGVQYSSGNNPTIRGGRTNNVDYEFEGMNYTDPYTQKNINGFNFPAFGLQSVQVSPGSEDASFGNSGVGTVNVVARRGSYPGVLDAAGGIGGPGFFHALDFGYGIGTANGRLSEFFSYTAHNTAPRYGGRDWTEDANTIGVKDYPMYLTDRELLSNTIYKFGRENRFSLQLLLNTGFRQTFGGYGDALSSNLCYMSCDPNQISFFPYATGVNGNNGLTIPQIQSLMVFMPGQTDVNQIIHRASYSEYGISNGSKLQLSWYPNSSTYIYTSADTTNGVTTSDMPNAGLWRALGGYNAETNSGLTKQLSDKNLLTFNIHTLRSRPLNEGLFPNDELFNITPNCCGGVGEVYDFVSPTDPNCPIGSDPSGQSYCGYLYRKLNISGPTGTLKLIPGGAGTRITGSSFDYSLGDAWNPNNKVKVNAGMRVENHRYHLPPYGQLPDCTSYYIPVAYTPPTQGTLPNGETGAFVNGKPVGPGNCPQAIFLPLTKDQTNPTVLEPRIAASLLLGLNSSIRVSYGRTARFPEGEASDYAPPANYGSQFAGIPAYLNPGMFAATGVYNNLIAGSPYTTTNPNDYYGVHGIPTDCGFAGYFVPCQTYQEQLYWSVQNGDFGNPIAPLKPVTYSNFDLSFSHQFRHGISMKLTGWTRRAFDLDIMESIPARSQFNTIIINPDGSVHSYLYKIPTNDGIEIADGLEFYLTKEQPFGLSGQLSATYNNVRQNVPGADEFHGLLQPQQANTGLYRVGYVSPFTSTLALSYKTHSGWRFQTRFDYDIGYPFGDGTQTSFTYAGNNYNVAHTNINGGNTQFVDPSNPGSVFNPHVAATLGTPESNQAQGELSHRNLVAELTIEKSIGKGALGISIANLFNEAYTGPTYVNGDFGIIAQGPFGALNDGSYYQGGSGLYLNPNYQPVATGVSGPLTGRQTNCTPNPSTGVTCLTTGGSVNGRGAYIVVPNGLGRSFYIYYTIHV